LVEGYYLSLVIHFLHRSGILAALRKTATVADIASAFNCDEALLSALMQFAHQRTDIFRIDAKGKYSVSPRYGAYSQLEFHLDKFIGAYGPAFARLDESLRGHALGESYVDANRLADAYSGLDFGGASLVGQLIREWNVANLLDLGCGPGRLLMELAQSDPCFEGWGMDSNPAMCALARRRLEASELSARVRVLQGDVRKIDLRTEPALGAVEAVHAGSLLNQFFGSGDDGAIALIRNLKNLFPGRLLFVSDYYGKLTRMRRVPTRYRHAVLQDVAQAISGQGVPPGDRTGWFAVYEAAGCGLVQAYEGDATGIAWFVHVVRLQGISPKQQPLNQAQPHARKARVHAKQLTQLGEPPTC